MTILDEILRVKRAEVKNLPAAQRADRHRDSGFVAAVRSAHPALIAEIKPKSPSEGLLLDRSAVPALVSQYEQRAQAISVLCDASFFGGGYELLGQVRALTKVPLLAKEFIIDNRQIDQAVFHGADAILLIASILGIEALEALSAYARSQKVDILFEVHGEEDINKVAKVYSRMRAEDRCHIGIGINNRNLADLTADIGTTIRLAPIIKKEISSDILIISESGISTSGDVCMLKAHVDGFLIGTSLLKSLDVKTHLDYLLPIYET